MNKRRRLVIIVVVCVAAAAALFMALRRSSIVLTGIVTTDETIVSSEIQGRLEQLAVRQGDAVSRGQELGTIVPAESKADVAYYDNLERSASAQVAQAEAELSYQQTLTAEQNHQAEANVAAAKAQVSQADADLEFARLSFERARNLQDKQVNAIQELDQTRAAFDGAKARASSTRQQVVVAEAALTVARAATAQVDTRKAALEASRRQLAAAVAQREKAEVRLGHTRLVAPVNGIVNLRAALPGEVVNPGQAILTLIDPDNLWVRADVEESYIDSIHLGDVLTVRLPSGQERQGTVFYRGLDADYATQRDVSRTKRDIKTFEVRLRCDNRDRSLAVGMTAYVEFKPGR